MGASVSGGRRTLANEPQQGSKPEPTGPVASEPVLPTTAAAAPSPWAQRFPPSRPPVTAGSIIARTFEIWRSHFWKVTGATVAVAVPAIAAFLGVGVVGALITPGFDPRAPSPLFWVLLAATFLLVAVPLGLVLMGGITLGAVRWLAGRPATIGEMLGAGARRLWPLFLTGLLVLLMTLVGYIFLIVPGIWLAVATSVALPAVMAERLGATSAVGRSFTLTVGARGAVFGAFLAMGAIGMAAGLVVRLVEAASPVAGLVANLALNAVITPLAWLVPAVAYHDLRAAKEGVDASELAKVFD